MCFSAVADCISAKSHALNRALYTTKENRALNLDFSSLMKSFKLQLYDVFFCQGLVPTHSVKKPRFSDQDRAKGFPSVREKEAQWPIGYGTVGLRIKRSSVRVRPWPLR